MRKMLAALIATAAVGMVASCSDDGLSTCAEVEREQAALVEPSTDEAWNDLDELEEYATKRFDLEERAAALGC